MNGRHSPVVRVGPGWGETEDRDLEGSEEEVEVKRQSGKDQNWLCRGQGRGGKQRSKRRKRQPTERWTRQKRQGG